MAETKDVKKDENTSQTSSENTTAEVKDSKTETASGEKDTTDKFKNPEELAKAYDGLQKKLGEQGDKLGQMETFMSNANALLNAVYSDPDIQKLVEQKYGGGQVSDNKQTEQQPSVTDPRLSEMEQMLRLKAVEEFDKKYNINETEVLETHKKIGEQLTKIGIDVRSSPLDLLPAQLDTAYQRAFPDKALGNARAEGAAQTMTNLQSQIPSQGGGSSSTEEGTVDLSTEQKDWAKKLGVSEDKIKDALKKHPE